MRKLIILSILAVLLISGCTTASDDLSVTTDESIKILTENHPILYSNTLKFDVGGSDGSMKSLDGFSIDNQGKIYIADSENNRITVFNPDGTFSAKIDPEITGSELRGPVDAQYVSGKIYIADTGNSRIRVYDSNLNYLSQIGTGYGSNLYAFRMPTDISVDSRKYVYVADSGNNRIQVYDEFGTFKNSIGLGAGNGRGYMKGPLGVYVYNNMIYVADTENNRIQIFSQNGESVGVIGGQSGSGNYDFMTLTDIVIDSKGRIYALDSGLNRVQVYGSDLKYLYTLGGTAGSGDYEFNGPGNLALSGNKLYVADRQNARIQIFTVN